MKLLYHTQHVRNMIFTITSVLVFLSSCSTVNQADHTIVPTAQVGYAQFDDLSIEVNVPDGWFVLRDESHLIFQQANSDGLTQTEEVVSIWIPEELSDSPSSVETELQGIVDSIRDEDNTAASAVTPFEWNGNPAYYYVINSQNEISLVVVLLWESSQPIAFNLSRLDANLATNSGIPLLETLRINNQRVASGQLFNQLQTASIPQLEPSTAMESSPIPTVEP